MLLVGLAYAFSIVFFFLHLSEGRLGDSDMRKEGKDHAGRQGIGVGKCISFSLFALFISN